MAPGRLEERRERGDGAIQDGVRSALNRVELLPRAHRSRSHRLEGDVLYCEYPPGGCAGCGYCVRSRKRMARHLLKNTHMTGHDGRSGHKVGVVVERTARIALATKAALEASLAPPCAAR